MKRDKRQDCGRCFRFGAQRAGEREGEGQRLPLAIDNGGRSGCAQRVHPVRPLPLLFGLTGCIRAAYLRGREAPERSGAERSEAERSGAEPWPLTSSIVGHNFSARRMYLILIFEDYLAHFACACGICF